MSKYIPATFQPTVRPDWGGVLSYLSDKEKSEILTALFKYPSEISEQCQSAFWKETIKPDLDLQYQTFLNSCKAKSRGVRNRWANTSIRDGIDVYNTSIRDGIDTERERERKREEEEEKEEGKKREEEKKNVFVAPSEQEFLTLAKQWNDFAGCGGFKNTEKQAMEFWNYYNSQGWVKSNGQHLTDIQSAYKLWVQRNLQNITNGGSGIDAETRQQIKTAWVGFSADYDNIQDFDDNFPWDKAYRAYCETKHKYPGESTGQKMREIMSYVYSNSDKLHRLHNVSPHLVFKDWRDFMQKDKCSWVDIF